MSKDCDKDEINEATAGGGRNEKLEKETRNWKNEQKTRKLENCSRDEMKKVRRRTTSNWEKTSRDKNTSKVRLEMRQ